MHNLPQDWRNRKTDVQQTTIKSFISVKGHYVWGEMKRTEKKDEVALNKKV